MNEKVKLPQALQRIHEEAHWARASFQTWKVFELADRDSVFCAVIRDPRYSAFFSVSIQGSFDLLVLSLGKIFDKVGGTINLCYLENKLNKGNYVEATEKLTKTRTEHRATIEKIRSIRNKSIAHNDPTSISKIFEEVGITPNEIKALIDVLCDILNEIAAELALPDRIAEGERNTKAVHSLLDILHRVHRLDLLVRND